jgi:hypothetical protein
MKDQALISLIALGSIAAAATADVVFVDAKAAIFDAGRDIPTLDGLLPPMLAIPQGADFVYVPEVTGLVQAHPVLQWGGPDGNMTTLNDTDINSHMGISGLITPGSLPLLGVFLTDAEPEGAGPDRLDFYQLGTDFASINPEIGQTFFIGDGWADAQTMQQFMVPQGATRFYLGLADASYFTGDPTAYHDNLGAFAADVRFNIVPAPGSIALFGLGAIAAFRRKR